MDIAAKTNDETAENRSIKSTASLYSTVLGILMTVIMKIFEEIYKFISTNTLYLENHR